MMSNISIDELIRLKNINIIDIRNEQNYNNNHITGAINIPYEKLIVTPEKYLNFDSKYFIYCQRGYSSVRVCEILARKGYRVVNINGGYEEWILKK